ncbi:neprilysin-2-like isoform X2 [Sitodiplosis mosellana]|uniref:neprilysin-2-like isoform X2 n=1 Tax=Sitodiplosis mosellana TaxID=263140 RepID=UPI002443753F|nr:neprilysin-2-like isoform X2 [Sitodiplosis mosellana]
MPRQRNEIVKESSCWQNRSLLEKTLLVFCIFAVIAILALSLSLYVLNLGKERYDTKLNQAEALRNARQLDQPYAKTSPDMQWRDGQTAPPSSPELSDRQSTQSIDGQIQIGQNQDASFPSTQDGHSQPAQYVSIGESQPKPAPVCETPGCVKAASNILKQLDEVIDPCDNFYEFACGNYIKETMLPEDKTSVDPFDKVRDLVQEQLRTIINEPPLPNESKPFKLAKNFNLACLNKTNIEAQGTKPLADILESFGGWPVVKGNSWSDATWDWVEVIKKFRRMGLPTAIIFNFDINTDLKNSKQRQLYIDQTDLELGREYLIEGIENKAVKAYHKFIVDNAVIFGADQKKAEEELKDVIELEIKLANISLSRAERRNASLLYHPVTIRELQESYPYLNWLDYINALLPSNLQVDENEILSNTVPKFFEQLGDILSSTPKRTMANYFLWRVILATSGTLTPELRQHKLQFYKTVYGLQGEQPRWKECIQFSSESLPISVGALYVRKYFSDESRKTAVEMVENIRDEFVNILSEIDWMDEKTRQEAIKKAKALTAHVGYPNELADNNKLEDYYQNLEIEPDNLLLNTLRLNVFNADHSFSKLRKPVNKTDWETHSKPAVVNAYYASLENSIQFPAAILQDVFFSADRPRYMNYASIGSVIGHEITHGFDDQGRQFDLDGNLVDWWDPETNKQFLEKAQCIIDQYGNYTDLKANLSLNGVNTQGENIADNGGTKESYIAYNKWVQRNGPEGTLPGLKYNQKQLFWISFAQSRCTVARDEFTKNKILTGFHAPNEFRIVGVLNNMPEFAYDFNCPEGTKMNPTHKCKVW